MRLPLTSATLAAALALLAPSASADWQISSEFRLHLTESTFDKLIQDFWQSLQGTQKVDVGNLPVNLGDTQLAINGIHVAVNYSFPVPARVDQTHREWQLQSSALSANVTVDQLLITRRKIIYIGGIPVDSTVTVPCNNVGLSLPAGLATVSATVSAEVAQNQVHLSMPTYNANWPANAWQVSSLSCPELGGLGDEVKAQILNYLSSFSNLDSFVSAALKTQFEKWSQQASFLLLSQEELPTNSDYLRVFYEPATAEENHGNGLILGGRLRFVYPYVAKDAHYEQDFSLPPGTQLVPQSTPQLVISFAAVKAMMMGEYFAGKLEYTMRSTEIPAFQSLLGSFWKKLFGWPELLHYSAKDMFLFQFLPMGPPSFTNETAGGANEIQGDLVQPLSLRMFAPLGGQFTPMVEFRTLLSGPASMILGSDGKINFKISATNQPVSYAYAKSYVAMRNPNTHIAASTIASSARAALNTDGIQLAIPNFKVGSNLTLVPTDWTLQQGSVLRLDFNASSATAAAVTTSAVKTTNGKTLSVSSAKAKK